MNKLVLKEFTKERVVYLYRPEDQGEWGEIVYLFADDKAKISKQPEDDIIGRYGYKAVRKVEEVVKKKNLPLEFTQAWY